MIRLKALFIFLFWQRCQSQSCPNAMFERYFGYILSNDLSSSVYRNKTFTLSSDMIESCWKPCNDDSRCQGFTVDFRKLICNYYQQIPERNTNFYQTQLIVYSDGAFFKKTCFNNLINCTYLWQFDHVPQTSMKFDSVGQSRSVASLEKCQEACLNETKLPCRSAVYNFQTKNCKLYYSNRRTVPNALINNRPDELYIENQCSIDLVTTCTFTQEFGTALSFALVNEGASNQSHCEQKCMDCVKFVCRGYHFDTLAKLCKLSADDSFTIGYAQNSSSISSAYHQRDECSDVQVSCAANRMTAKFRLDRQFNGKIFSLKQPNDCNFDFNKQFDFNVSMSLEKRDVCGIVVEETNTLIAMMRMQYHDSVKTVKDKTLKVICRYDLTGQTVQSFVEVNESTAPPTTSLVTGGGPLPEAYMRIVNGEGQTVTTAEVGQILYAEVILRDVNGSSTGPFEYGLFVTGCEAFDEGQKVILIDQFGCPLDTSLFEGFYPVSGSDNRILRAAFQGFRFQTKRRVNINCNVNFCFRFCQPNLCTDRNGRRVMSYGKKRKRKRSFINEEKYSGTTRVGSSLVFNEDPPNFIVLEDNKATLSNVNQTLKLGTSGLSSKNISSFILTGIVFFVSVLFIVLIAAGLKISQTQKNSDA